MLELIAMLVECCDSDNTEVEFVLDEPTSLTDVKGYPEVFPDGVIKYQNEEDGTYTTRIYLLKEN